MGFGDIAVNKKMKVFIATFYGKIANYSKGVDLIQQKKVMKYLTWRYLTIFIR